MVIFTKTRKKQLKQRYLQKFYPLRLKPNAKKLLFNQKFEPSDLTKISFRIYKRISEIYGIPVRKLLPVYQGKPPLSLVRMGSYNTSSHEIKVRSKKFLEHELLHSIQEILIPIKTNNKEFVKFRETTTEIKGPSLIGFLSTLGAHMSTATPLKYITGYAITEAIIKTIFGSKRFANYFKKHGPDGLILLYASPPKNFNLFQIKNWEKQAIQKGYLKIEGGLTRKGMQFIREICPRQEIIKKLNEMRA